MSKYRGNVVVTGAGRGLGQRIAIDFAYKGYRVFGTSRTEAELRTTANRIEKGFFVYKVADFSEPSQVTEFGDWVKDQGCPIDFLINNAAVLEKNDLQMITKESWCRTMQVNLNAPFFLTQALLPHFQKDASVVNISSLGGLNHTEKFPKMVAYTTSKAALVGLTEVMAKDLEERGIAVFGIAPGALDTLMLKKAEIMTASTVSLREVSTTVVELCLTHKKTLSGVVIPIYSNRRKAKNEEEDHG